MIELYFSTVKILAQRPTHISAVATILLITKTFTVKYYYGRIVTGTIKETGRGGLIKDNLSIPLKDKPTLSCGGTEGVGCW